MTRANFKVEPELWWAFRTACTQHKVNASEVLRAFVQEQVVCWTYPDTHEPPHKNRKQCEKERKK
jgi:hypothetical protein